MTSLRKKVLAALSSGAMLLSVVTPAVAQTTLQVTGNGSDSTSNVNLTQVATTNVVQSNQANISNNVDANANTGNNDADRNTGGNVAIDTGNASSDVSVSNSVNSNSANVDCCAANDTSVLIAGNGDNTTNNVDLTQGNETSVFQDNRAHIDNDIYSDANTGRNDANRNTGGDVEILTGKASSNVDVSNTANANWANVGGGNGDENGSVDVRIIGNGSDSDNDVDLLLAHSTVLSQDNSARIYNDVDADANSGKNDAERNTGGEVLIDTGDASVDVDVDNAVNFNWADVNCGCLLDVFAKISGNGDNSDNDIKAVLGDSLDVFQDNCGEEGSKLLLGLHRKDGCKIDNDVDADAKTGINDADRNTGSPEGGDPAIYTGNADTNVDISNSGNSNAYGVDSDWEWPEFEVNWNLSLGGLSLADLLALLSH